MRMFARATLSAIAGAFIGLAPMQSEAAQCGTDEPITVAEMSWLSAATLAHVVDKILTEGYGCTVEIVPGDTVPTATSMLSKGEPMVAPELWLSTAEAIWARMQDKGNVYKAADVFESGGVEGFWIPDYVAKANPGLRSVADLPRYAKLFEEPASGGKGRIYGCPPGWGCEIVTTNLFEALDLEAAGYELFSPGSGANLKASIARKVARKQPLLAYYWGPTPVIGKYGLVRLEMPPYDAEKFKCLTRADCENPQATDWKSGEVAVVALTELKESAPAVAEFLGRISLPNETVNEVLAWGDDQSASAEEIATRLLREYPDAWRSWVPADVADKVKASL